jgi:hypothetical protein
LKWTKAEDEFLKECEDKKIHLEKMYLYEGLKGRSLDAI